MKKKTYLFCGVGSSWHTEHLALSASGLGVLSPHSVAPVVADTSVRSDLLQPLNVVSDGADQHVDDALGGLARGVILLPVNEPIWHFELLGVVDDRHQLLDLLVGQGARTAIYVDFGLLADDVGETLSDAADLFAEATVH